MDLGTLWESDAHARRKWFRGAAHADATPWRHGPYAVGPGSLVRFDVWDIKLGHYAVDEGVS